MKYQNLGIIFWSCNAFHDLKKFPEIILRRFHGFHKFPEQPPNLTFQISRNRGKIKSPSANRKFCCRFRFLSSAGAERNCALPMRLPHPSPILNKNRAPMGSESLSSTQAGVWRKWALFRNTQPVQIVWKHWQYTFNLYRRTPPICNAVPCWLLSLEERETPQHTSNLYCNTPPIYTTVRLLAEIITK